MDTVPKLVRLLHWKINIEYTNSLQFSKEAHIDRQVFPMESSGTAQGLRLTPWLASASTKNTCQECSSYASSWIIECIKDFPQACLNGNQLIFVGTRTFLLYTSDASDALHP